MVSSETVFLSMLVPGGVVVAARVGNAATSKPAAASAAQEQRMILTAMTLPLPVLLSGQV
jgi:hypothetical protein